MTLITNRRMLFPDSGSGNSILRVVLHPFMIHLLFLPAEAFTTSSRLLYHLEYYDFARWWKSHFHLMLLLFLVKKCQCVTIHILPCQFYQTTRLSKLSLELQLHVVLLL